MSSAVGICNLALSHLGDAATVASIDPPEGSAQAKHCARFYPVARDSLLEMRGWKFATRRGLLALTAANSWNYKCAYAEPDGALRIISVLSPTEASTADTAAYETISGDDGEPLIVTDLEGASCIYTVFSADASNFSALFSVTLSWYLASMLAGPMLKGEAGAAESKRCLQMMQGFLSQAAQSDAAQHKTTLEHTPGWIGGR